MTLNALSMFDAAARHENFRKAAQELNLTQGAVAQQIRALEDRLGLKLFTRKPRGLALTEAGRQYHTEIAKALQIIHKATENLQHRHSITISVTPSLASKWLMPKLSQLVEIMPDIDLKIHASEQRTDILRGEADIAIRQGPPPIHKDLEVRKLSPINYVAVATPDKFSAAPELQTIAALPLIQDSHGHWNRLCQAFGLPVPKTVLNVNQTALAIDAAIAGQGVALAPRLLVEDALAANLLQVIWQDPRPTSDGFHVITAKANRMKNLRDVANYLAGQSPSLQSSL